MDSCQAEMKKTPTRLFGSRGEYASKHAKKSRKKGRVFIFRRLFGLMPSRKQEDAYASFWFQKRILVKTRENVAQKSCIWRPPPFGPSFWEYSKREGPQGVSDRSIRILRDEYSTREAQRSVDAGRRGPLRIPAPHARTGPD